MVGAGFTGLSAALTLAAAGREVTVLDRAGVGAGASGRNGGQVLTGFSPDLADLERRLGPATAARAWRLAWEAKAAVPELGRRYGFEAGWEERGHVEAGLSEAVLNRFRAEADAVARLGRHRLGLWDQNAMTAGLGTAFYRGGLFDPASGAVQPLSLAYGLGEAARARGVHLVWPVRVTGIETDGAGVRITAATGPGHRVLSARKAVVAVNAGLPWVLPGLKGRIRPIRAWIVATAPLPPEVAAGVLPSGVTVSDTKRLMAYYRRTPDHRLVFGGRPSLWRRSPSASWRLLGEALERLFPRLAPVTLEFAWSGPIALSADGLPHLGHSHHAIWYADGLSGHGVALSLAAGRALARAALEEEPLEETPWASFGPLPALPSSWTWGIRNPF